MNKLIVLENGIVPVYQGEDGKLVNARELHEFLKVGTKFTDWIKERVEKYGFTENEDFTLVSEKRETNNPKNPYTNIIEYILTLDTAKEIAMVQNNSKGSQARKYFIAVEKKYKEIAKPACIEDVLIQSLQEMKDIKQQINEVNHSALQASAKAEETKEEVQAMRDIITLNPNSWRKDSSNLINKMALNAGGYEHIRAVREESYRLLNTRLGVDIKIRLTNKRRRMADEGVCKSKRDKLTALDVIADDKKLIEGYLAIVKEMSIKYKA
ncbi:antA/AntB antirepressor family protein [Clostridium algidicarnis]|uniref:antA/AntB antirepressor family protein n=1 Tax=Clostridium algidicarnis TaxID=37659 RepID=UPI003FD8DD84